LRGIEVTVGGEEEFAGRLSWEKPEKETANFR
jgi:hypothetical protein